MRLINVTKIKLAWGFLPLEKNWRICWLIRLREVDHLFVDDSFKCRSVVHRLNDANKTTRICHWNNFIRKWIEILVDICLRMILFSLPCLLQGSFVFVIYGVQDFMPKQFHRCQQFEKSMEKLLWSRTSNDSITGNGRC